MGTITDKAWEESEEQINNNNHNKMETLQISKNNAMAAFRKADQNGKTLLSTLFGPEVFNQKVTDRIKTFDDVLEDQGISEEHWHITTNGLSPDEIAYKQIKLIAKALNEGWEPDWDDSEEYKYYPYFRWVGSGVGFSYYDYNYDLSNSTVGSRLVYKSRELAEYAGKQFTDIYNRFLK